MPGRVCIYPVMVGRQRRQSKGGIREAKKMGTGAVIWLMEEQLPAKLETPVTSNFDA